MKLSMMNKEVLKQYNNSSLLMQLYTMDTHIHGLQS